MRNPAVSIIVPNYNHGKFLLTRLNSILNQTFQNFEIILLDDHSSDKSADVLRHFSSHPKVSHVIVNEVNSESPFKQWQRGIELAKGDYIWIAESDDFCTTDFLHVILAFFNKHKALGIVYSQSVDVDENGNILSNRIEWTSDFAVNIWENNFYLSGEKFVQDYLKRKNVIPNASAVVFKRKLIKGSFFTEKLLQMKMCGDWLFWLKLCSVSNVGFVAQSLNFFRNHSLSSRNHTTYGLKTLRLIEERDVRRTVTSLYSTNQKKETETLYRKWIYLHPQHNILKPRFYGILIKRSHLFKLFLLWFKINIYER